MADSEDKADSYWREDIRGLHRALDRLELYFQKEPASDEAGEDGPLDLVLRLRRRLIQSSARSGDGSRRRPGQLR